MREIRDMIPIPRPERRRPFPEPWWKYGDRMCAAEARKERKVK
jgi:hypothetical protein